MSDKPFEHKGEKLIDELWFASGEFVGSRLVILITESTITRERRARIGVVLGLNADADRERTIEYGDKLTVQQLERILAALRADA